MPVPSDEREHVVDGPDTLRHRMRRDGCGKLREAYAASTTSLKRKESTSSVSGECSFP